MAHLIQQAVRVTRVVVRVRMSARHRAVVLLSAAQAAISDVDRSSCVDFPSQNATDMTTTSDRPATGRRNLSFRLKLKIRYLDQRVELGNCRFGQAETRKSAIPHKSTAHGRRS
jgi:hypothetical protein